MWMTIRWSFERRPLEMIRNPLPIASAPTPNGPTRDESLLARARPPRADTPRNAARDHDPDPPAHLERDGE